MRTAPLTGVVRLQIHNLAGPQLRLGGAADTQGLAVQGVHEGSLLEVRGIGGRGQAGEEDLSDEASCQRLEVCQASAPLSPLHLEHLELEADSKDLMEIDVDRQRLDDAGTCQRQGQAQSRHSCRTFRLQRVGPAPSRCALENM